MHYLGGKSRIAKKIAPYLGTGDLYYEPFLGGGSVYGAVHSSFTKTVVSDIHLDLILMWQALRDGWTPPDTCFEEEYKKQRNEQPSPWRGLVGYGQSYGGKWFGGYARGFSNDGVTPRNHLAEANRNNAKIAPFIQDIRCCSYDEIEPPKGSTVYCDPPYANTTKYSMDFDHDKFWETMRLWRGNGVRVFVSEYEAPEDFTCLAEFYTKQHLSHASQSRGSAITERLFV